MQGLYKNRYQFGLLVLANAFVGAMLGLERSILPEFGRSAFGINGHTVLMSFIMAFGISKAISNYSVSVLSAKLNRKKILILGWVFGLPVPFMLMYAPHWNWVILANVLLGINQGLAWSATVIMKIDLVGEQRRGLAMGVNEFAGYLSVGLAAYLASAIASEHGYSFFPFIPGVLFVFAGLILSVFFIKDTMIFVHSEASSSDIPFLQNIWKQTSWKHRNIGPVTLNGLVNNLNDGVMWGLLPLLLVQRGYTIAQVGVVAGIYPLVWGIAQLFTGHWGDNFCKKQLITIGMNLQGFAILFLVFSPSFYFTAISSVLLGFGTALVYPNFLAVVAENSHPQQRAATLSIFRFWRDSGYVIGALLSGLLADYFGISTSLVVIAGITAFAGIFANARMCCTKRVFWHSETCNPA